MFPTMIHGNNREIIGIGRFFDGAFTIARMIQSNTLLTQTLDWHELTFSRRAIIVESIRGAIKDTAQICDRPASTC